MTPARRALLLSFGALVFALGCGGGSDPSTGEVKRVTLTGNYLTSTTGQGWNLEDGRVATDTADADFQLTMTMVIMLFPNKPQVGFCQRQPPGGAAGFARVEDVPGDVAGCTSWAPADLGGNTPVVANSIGGQGYLVRDRNAVPIAKLRTVSGSIVGADVAVTFDIVKL